MPAQRLEHEDLREACILEALTIIETSGVENLSLREVARRLNVSHQAPYKHFPSRDHILAEIVSRAFESFAHHLDNSVLNEDPIVTLERMGRAYLEYASLHPLQYRLMFGTPLPDAEKHPNMMQSARHAFNLLRDCIKRTASENPDLDALFAWSTLHGLATILQMGSVGTLHISPALMNQSADHILFRVYRGLYAKDI